MNVDSSNHETGIPFWKSKNLSQMTSAEWESLCDSCGLCCFHKLEDIDTKEIFFSNVACRLLDLNTFRCTDYADRARLNPGCIILSPDRVEHLKWLPKTCAYRLIHEGKDLSWWHPLISGDPESVHLAGISLKGRAIRELDIDIQQLEDHIVDWMD